jgi:hypothetical protein
MYKIIHTRCGTEVNLDDKIITEGYATFCEHCNEDLDIHENHVEVPQVGKVTFEDIYKVNKGNNLEVFGKENNHYELLTRYFGVRNKIDRSTMEYDHPLQVRIYDWAKTQGHC